MKLRIRGNSLRLRLTRGEVAELHESGCCEESIRFGPDSALGYRVESSTGDDLAVRYRDNLIVVEIPADMLHAWATTEQVSLRPASSNGPALLVEKDFACLVDRPGEDDSDAYAHPGADSSH